MFSLNDTMRYFLCPGRTDMRKGISSLCGLVHEKMKSEVGNGDVFIFVGFSRKLMKLLHAEDGGMVMYVKRLEAGRFKLPEYDPESNSYPMEWRDLGKTDVCCGTTTWRKMSSGPSRWGARITSSAATTRRPLTCL